MDTPAPSSQGVPFGIVVMAASVGGVGALGEVVGQLPRDFPVPVVIAQHRSLKSPHLLAQILQRRTALPVVNAAEGLALAPGVHVLPPRSTLVIDGGYFREGGPALRPADTMLVSAAQAFGARTCAVVLTGYQDDGTKGVRAVKKAGGMVLAEDPASAHAPGMPTSAIATGCVDLVLPLPVIGPALVALTMAPGVVEMFPRLPSAWANLPA